MPRLLLRTAAILAAVLISLPSFAQDFVVRDIRLEGLQRISAGTVFNYLPVKVGESATQATTADAIKALFATGFFQDVKIERDGDALVVVVQERPSIATIEFVGNKSLATEELLESLKQVGFAEGRIFNRLVFDQVEYELRNTYFSAGKYGVKLDSTVTPLERNRVGIQFDVSEGAVARIKEINLVGNSVFDDDELLDLFNLSTTRVTSFITKSDQYSKQKLSADLETLRSYYLDQGYINFDVDSTQVSITPDKLFVYITINLSEGDQYTISDIKLAGDWQVPNEELFELVTVDRGGVFSRREVTETSALLGERLGVDGYAFANINAVPDINEETKQVDLTFFIDPGKRVYVRRLNFAGNTKTRDEVLRREMRQLEGSWVSTAAIERSRVRLERLNFFRDITIETPAVPGTTDQVDVNIGVTEASTGNLLAGAGFSQTQGLVLDLGVSQDNFLGTGNRVSIRFNNSDVSRNFSFSWFNPYWTVNGVSRGFEAYYRKTDADNANVSDYELDELGGALNFGVPISEFNRINFGVAVAHQEFNVGDDASDEVRAFEAESGGEFNTVRFTGSWASDSRDNRLLPTSGALTRLSGEVTVPGLDLNFYKTRLKHQRYLPLFGNFVLSLNGEVAYGDGFGDTNGLPLIENLFAGGPRSLRGFRANTLGPRDSNDEPLGGSFKTVGNVELIVPTPFAPDSKTIRVSGFLDGGNVFSSTDDFELEDFRYSAGVSGTWISPLGPMTFSFAVPLESEAGDDKQQFQFLLGTTF